MDINSPINTDFTKGYITSLEPQSVKDGVVTNGLNWMFINGDHIELRRGYKIIGSDVGVGKVTGLRSGRRFDGTEVLFRTRTRKIEYYDEVTSDWIETGSDSLPTAASGEDIAIEPYSSLAGDSVYLSSPNSSIYKIMIANPSSLIDMSSTTFRGKIKIKNNRMLLWDRLSSTSQRDKTGLYGSKLDKDSFSDYTSVTSESVGSSGSTTYTGTLAFKAGGAKRSCFGVVFTDGTLTISDDGDGTLSGNGSGTINYATGAYSITFSSVTTGSVTASYQWEDPTSGGIADFTAPSSPRTAGQSFIIRQDDGGGSLQNIGHYNSHYYCLHEKKTWDFYIGADDVTDVSNLPYRDKAGISNWRALAETGEGIYYIDESYENVDDVKVRLLTLQQLSTEVIPKSISDLITLQSYRFDKAMLKEWGRYIVLACRTSNSVENNRIFLYDRELKLWNPPHDLQVNVMDVYNGALLGGDSTTANVYELYSGFDDDDSTIPNYVELNITNLRTKGLKQARRVVVEGDIQPDQTLKVSVSIDRSPFVEVAEISGRGEYVDKGQATTIGSVTLGKKEVGGGSTVTAYHYKLDKRISSDRFDEIQFRFEATAIGYVSVTKYGLNDVRYKSEKTASKYIQN